MAAPFTRADMLAAQVSVVDMYTQWGIVFKYEKEWGFGIHYNRDESQKHYAK